MAGYFTVPVILMSLLLPQDGSAQEKAVRVSVCIYRGETLDGGLTDLVNVELSNREGLEILERSDVELIFQEWSRIAFTKDPLRQVLL